MNINGVELELDIYDADTAEKYEKVIDDVQCIAEEVKDTKASKGIRIQCEAIFKVFNDLFGEGTDKKIFGEKVNLLSCIKAFEELVTQVNEQKGELEKITSKYSPNRVQRRTKK
ncbi:MAG: DUF6673 family protein [Clostridium sp.]|uniref:DUF6673 family protein n=1 Tax=Clostridium sp. TaxID=1506 RepID=UPI00302B0011